MKTLVSLFAIGIFVGSLFFTSKIEKPIKENIVLHQTDSVFHYQQRFQDYVDTLSVIRPFDVNLETNDLIMLESKEELKSYVKFLIPLKYPKARFSEIHVSEDKTKKIWFAYTNMENAYMGNNMMIIICKDNCKILLFAMDR
jgi:hypothetical protein